MTLDSRVDLITTGNLRKALFSLAVPAVLMMIGIMLFEIIDMFWVGRTNESGTAAVSAASYIIWTIKSLAILAGTGINTLIGRTAGAKNWSRVGDWLWRGITLALSLSLIFGAVGMFYLQDILSFMQLKPETMDLSYNYLVYFFISLPFVFLFGVFESTFRALGDTRTPFIITTVALAFNTIADPLLIFGWLGFPQMGVPGSALASLIAHVIAVVLFIMRFSRSTLDLTFRFPYKNLIREWWQIIKIGSPIAFSGALFSVIYIFITRIVSLASSMGVEDPLLAARQIDINISAMGVGQRWESLVYFTCVAVSAAVATLVSQNLGSGNIDRAKASANMAVRYLLIYTGIISLLFIFFGETLGYILMPDPAVAEATARYLFIIGIFEITMSFEFGLEGAFIGSGNTLPAFLISFPLNALRVPLAWYLAIEMDLGVEAIWWTLGFTMLLKGFLFAVWFYRGKWVHSKVLT